MRDKGSTISTLTLAALSFVGGCGRPDESQDARPSIVPKSASLGELVMQKDFQSRERISLGDIPGSSVELSPTLPYLVEVPHGTFKQVRSSVIDHTWGPARTDDRYVFEVPGDPSNYALQIERYIRSTKYLERPNGNYMLLRNLAEGGKIESAVFIPVRRNFYGPDGTIENLILFKSTASGQIYQVTNPKTIENTNKMRMPRHIKELREKIFSAPPLDE
jgi:hypothetical protein